jgi:cell division septation protein DedD
VAESHEPSYYEIALTNRQVFVALILLLTCVLAAFLSGVWIGREATARAVQEQMVRNAPPPQTPQDGKNLEELEFFDRAKRTKGETGGDHRQAAAAPQPAAGSTLLDDLTHRKPKTIPVIQQPPPPAQAEEVVETPAPAPKRARPAPPTPTPPIVADSTSSAAAAPPTPARKAKSHDRTASRTAAAAVPGKGAYVIQVFSSADKAQAERIRDRLTGGGQKAFLSPIDRGGRTMYRVRVGPFKSHDEAQKVADKVRKGYRLDTWVTE